MQRMVIIMKKITFSTELAYIAGTVSLACGTAFMEKAKLGLSMVVAPSYLIYVKLSEVLPFFTFGMAEYLFQALIILTVAAVLKRFKTCYLFSFFTAVFYGLILDFGMLLLKALPVSSLTGRLLYFDTGMLLCSLGIAFIFRTYITPAAYEIFVKEISAKTKIGLYQFKIIYDYSSCLFSIILSFALFGRFRFIGINIGTIVFAFVNGLLILNFKNLFDKVFDFKDCFDLKRFFE